MRKATAIALVFLLGAAAALGGEGTRLEEVVPADAVALVQVTDLTALRQAFEQSALADHVKSSQLLTYLATVAGAAADFGAVLLSGRPAEEMRATLGSQMGLVLLDFESPQAARQRLPVALLIEASDPRKLEEVVTTQLQLFSLLRPRIALSERQEGGTRVHEVTLPRGVTLAYCVRGRFLIAGSGYAVRTLLAADGPSLVAEPTFQAVRKRLATTGGLAAYLNVRRLLERMGIAADPLRMQRLRAAGIAEVKAAGLALDFEGGQVRERLYLHTGGPQTGLFRLLTQGGPVSGETLRFVPPNYTVAMVLALKDVGLWDRMSALLTEVQGPAAAGNMDAGANFIQQQAGIQIREGFFDTLGEELVLAADLSRIGQFAGAGRQPKPDEIPFLFAAKLRDPAALTDTLDRVAANEKLFEQGIDRLVKKHGDVDLYAFRIPFRSDLQPSYAIVDKVFLFSLRAEAVAAAIDAQQAGKSFAATPAAATLAKPAHLRLVVNDAQLLSTLLGLLRDEVPEAAKRLVPEVERILASLHGHAAVVRREAEGISLTAQSDLGTTGTFLAAAVLLDQFNRVIGRRVNADFDTISTALEAYRKERGAYPGSLNELVPDFVPDLPRDRFKPERGYGYGRGTADAQGRLPDAWILTSVGPDKDVDVPVEQFDPPEWHRRATRPTLDEIPGLKQAVYQFRREQFEDERKNDDEGDIVRMGGKGLLRSAPRPPTRAPKPPAAPADAPENF